MGAIARSMPRRKLAVPATHDPLTPLLAGLLLRDPILFHDERAHHIFR